jgi:hypothetical protein
MNQNVDYMNSNNAQWLKNENEMKMKMKNMFIGIE